MNALALGNTARIKTISFAKHSLKEEQVIQLTMSLQSLVGTSQLIFPSAWEFFTKRVNRALPLLATLFQTTLKSVLNSPALACETLQRASLIRVKQTTTLLYGMRTLISVCTDPSETELKHLFDGNWRTAAHQDN